MKETSVSLAEKEPRDDTVALSGDSQTAAGEPTSGYIFLCRNATQLECLEKKLFAATDRDLDRLFAHIKEDTRLFLVNIHSGVMVGVFQPVGGPERDIEPGAFGGGFSAQVRVKPLSEPLLATRLAWPVGSGPRSAQDAEYLHSLLLGGEQVDPFAVDPHDYTFRPPAKGYKSSWGVILPGKGKPVVVGKGVKGQRSQVMMMPPGYGAYWSKGYGGQRYGPYIPPPSKGQCTIKGKRQDTPMEEDEEPLAGKLSSDVGGTAKAVADAESGHECAEELPPPDLCVKPGESAPFVEDPVVVGGASD